MMEKYRVLVVSHALELGGAERALLGLLGAFDAEKYDIDLFLLRHSGELLPCIPKYVHLLPEIKQYTCLAEPIGATLKKGAFAVAFGRAHGKYAARRFLASHPSDLDQGVSLEYSHKYTKRLMPKISTEQYDLAISFLTPHYFVAEKVSAKKKIAWIHTDYSALQIDIASEQKMWSAYDWIASISDQCTAGFLKKFPSLRERIVRIDNITLPALICQQGVAEPPEGMEKGTYKLLSVGRFCAAKNFDNVPDICRILRKAGCDVHWYLIGFGGDEALIRSKIIETEMEDFITILGKKTNPYPYMKACDLYVQPSRYEGNCVAVHEAQILGKPVVITRYATSASQLVDGVDGVIVPMDNEGCAAGIAALLRDPARMEQLSQVCKSRDYSNREEVKKLYQLLG